jgi:hypothetical protein
MVAVTDDGGTGSLEPADETTCGDEDLAGHILPEITGQVDVCRCDLLRRRRIE